ncbi:hypothetical protein PG991_014963 [Apiospora marii]|uniref:Uncharacterized protein n=1 Tax=Apiospora marii TaxID=335849 RepID=A0ABR1R2R3_9PEZI
MTQHMNPGQFSFGGDGAVDSATAPSQNPQYTQPMYNGMAPVIPVGLSAIEANIVQQLEAKLAKGPLSDQDFEILQRLQAKNDSGQSAMAKPEPASESPPAQASSSIPDVPASESTVQSNTQSNPDATQPEPNSDGMQSFDSHLDGRLSSEEEAFIGDSLAAQEDLEHFYATHGDERDSEQESFSFMQEFIQTPEQEHLEEGYAFGAKYK